MTVKTAEAAVKATMAAITHCCGYGMCGVDGVYGGRGCRRVMERRILKRLSDGR